MKKKLIRGATIVELVRHTDERGTLISLASDSGAPFNIQRTFFIYGCPADTIRAEHASSAEMFLVAATGSLIVDLDNGDEQGSVILAAPQQGLHVKAGVWVRLREFSHGAILLVASSDLYKNITYFDNPVKFSEHDKTD